MEVVVQALPVLETTGRQVMQTPEDVALMLRLKAAGLGVKKIAARMARAAQRPLRAETVAQRTAATASR